jgi:hypothetical protein
MYYCPESTYEDLISDETDEGILFDEYTGEIKTIGEELIFSFKKPWNHDEIAEDYYNTIKTKFEY